MHLSQMLGQVSAAHPGLWASTNPTENPALQVKGPVRSVDKEVRVIRDLAHQSRLQPAAPVQEVCEECPWSQKERNTP